MAAIFCAALVKPCEVRGERERRNGKARGETDGESQEEG